MKKRAKTSFLFNFWKNYLWILLGIFTISLAVWLEYAQRYFIISSISPIIPYHHLSDPYIPVIITISGSFSVITGIWNIEKFFAKAINVFMMEFVWLFIAIGDIQRAIALKQLSVLGVVAVFIAFLAILAYVSPSMMSRIITREELQANERNRKLLKK